jgi:hypothetical protein
MLVRDAALALAPAALAAANDADADADDAGTERSHLQRVCARFIDTVAATATNATMSSSLSSSSSSSLSPPPLRAVLFSPFARSSLAGVFVEAVVGVGGATALVTFLCALPCVAA